MHRSVLKLIAFTAIAISMTLFVLAFSHHDSVEAAANKWTSTQKQGALTALDQNGKPSGECPLKHTQVKAEVSGFISRVTVTQEFQNPFSDKIEAVYTFPLPQSAAVDDLTMIVGNRTIKGKIMRREEAQAAYTTAKQAGQVASLLNQERPNIFTQSVANIMPGQPVQVTISYVETLKYEDGSYEWVFPMVVGPRYMPAGTEATEATVASEATTEPLAQPTSLGSSPVSEDVRGGHDISLEVAIDAGVSIEDLKSETHETEIDRPDSRRAVVRLKDQDVIPNKDFVLRYQVAGNRIEDAVLTHRSERGGFFTLILQPPQRVVAEDVMPKELVFVLDTSGSMGGFPLDKAKETIDLALNNLYPHDTFNLITFAGDTDILFPDPVPATPENLQKARSFLKGRSGNGGTEMMKAIKAALEPSDSQQHVRISCFLTDGQVGNDFEIISEVQKHPNARVFAMGFGTAPNRYLLDKMTEVGRGEVQYIDGNGVTSLAAQRFNERIRNPLMTDISIDWSDLPITDVYPKNIPDLFGVSPVILSGRYTKGAKGIIRLKGMMAGNPFVREIPVELPETETEHDVLSTLWARRRIDDVMSGLLATQNGVSQEDAVKEITQLGLEYKLMTQYTSFVAIDQFITAPPGDPTRVDVPANTTSSAVAGPGSGIQEMVMVSADYSVVNVDTASFGTTITTRSIENLPLQGRNVTSLMVLSPGTAPGNGNAMLPTNAISVNGQRSSANNLMVDGVSANFGIAAGGQSPGSTAAGTSPALTASGGSNGIASQDSTSELRVTSSGYAAEYGRSSGAQVNIVTKSGTNTFHGSLFHFFGNDAFDASDSLANSRGLDQPERRLNNFGGTFEGPIKKNEAFFFGSYEGLRLRQPMASITLVPSTAARLNASPDIQQLLSAFPLANGTSSTNGFSEFAASFSNPARHDTGNVRIDVNLTDHLNVNGRYSFTDSDANQRGAGGFSLNTINKTTSFAQTFTGAFTFVLSPRIVLDFHANYSRLAAAGAYSLDDFGGALIPSDLVSQGTNFTLDLNGRNSSWKLGNPVSSIQRQFNTVGNFVAVEGHHSYKIGIDYRRVSPIIGLRDREQNIFFDGVDQLLTGVANRLSVFNHIGPQEPVFNNLSLYAQDEWKQSTRLTINYGIRWELDPAPHSDPNALAVDQIDDLSTINLTPRGSSLWKTTYLNFAPRVGAAYELSGTSGRELVLRGSVGVLFDTGQERAGEAFADSFPFLTGASNFNVPIFSVPPSTTSTLPFSVFDPHLKLPYTLSWNATIQRGLGYSQSIYASYVGTRGNRLLSTETLFDQNQDFPFIRLTRNGARSDYHALQVGFERHISRGLTALVNYTWSKSIDNSSMDSAARVLVTTSSLADDRGPSDFDMRHLLSGQVSFDIPALRRSGLGNTLLRNWALDSIFNAHSSKPVNIVYGFPTTFGLAYVRPDLLDGVSPYLLVPELPGGRKINPAAFLISPGLQQGNLGRNSLRGFPLYQIDLALRRRFNFTEAVALQFQVDAFNLLNHPNFEDPLGTDLSFGTLSAANTFTPNSTFGESASLSGRSVLNGGSFGSFYSTGGPRALRFSLRLTF